jgi:tRNA-(ms[2]io[6]A)-hydroxylase
MSGAAAFAHPLLRAATPGAWIAAACALPEVLLIDHANCEKKAASTALALMFAYAEDLELTDKRYAAQLRRLVARGEPQREVDLMICGAFIEARSCERFAALGAVMLAPLGELFRGLHEAESRHYLLYVDLAARAAARADLNLGERIAAFAACEAQLITDPDPVFRFHSGPPQRAGVAARQARGSD